MTIAIDFDGTLVYHDYPFIVERLPFAFETLRELKKRDHTLILLTMRADNLLDEAIAFCRLHDVEFDFINSNSQFETGSRKVYANLYIDDHGLGIPLIYDLDIHRKPFVDWNNIYHWMREKGIL
jgi:phosphoserine phosphatase